MSELGADVIGIGLDPPTKPSHFKVAQIEREIEPNAEHHAAYKPFFESYKNTYSALRNIRINLKD